MKALKRFWNWLKKVKNFFGKKGLLTKYIPIAVDITQAIKKAIDSGSLDTVTELAIKLFPVLGLPAHTIVEFLKKEIPDLCLQLEILEAGQQPDVMAALNALKNTYGDKWSGFMSGISGKLYIFISNDGRLDWKESAEIGSDYYDKVVKGK